VEIPCAERLPLVRTVYQLRDAAREFGAREFAGAERGQVGGGHLAVDHADVPACEAAHEVHQRDFRGIRHKRKHRFAVEHAAEGHAVKAAGEFAGDPGFHRMCDAGGVQFAVGRDHLLRDPRSGVRSARRSAGAHDGLEGRVHADCVIAAREALAQRARHFEFGREQHHARIGAPPQHRLAVAEPREDAVAVGVGQARDGQVGPRGEQAVGLAQCARDGGKGIGGLKPRNHEVDFTRCRLGAGTAGTGAGPCAWR